MGYERYALVLDDGDSGLGRAAMQLLEVGIDVLYANDPDEAQLLARQEAGRLGAVLISDRIGAADVEVLVAKVCSRMDAGARCLVVTGDRPDAAACDRLRDLGLEWGIFHPFELRDLRFVMATAMSAEHRDERRKYLRIPTDLPTTVFMGRHRKEVVLHDLSETGAYFATPFPFLEDSALSIELPLPRASVLGKAVVVNAKTADKPGRPDVPEGMGVVFDRMAPDAVETVRGTIADWLGRFRI
jgi:hypothetical protein